MVTNNRPVCASEGPSYDKLMDQHKEVITNIYNKACEIQSKLVPPFELPPKDQEDEGLKDPTLFGALASEFQDLIEIEQVLDTIIRIL